MVVLLRFFLTLWFYCNDHIECGTDHFSEKFFALADAFGTYLFTIQLFLCLLWSAFFRNPGSTSFSGYSFTLEQKHVHVRGTPRTSSYTFRRVVLHQFLRFGPVDWKPKLCQRYGKLFDVERSAGINNGPDQQQQHALLSETS